MLSTSRTKFQNPYLLVAITILVLVSAIVVYQSGVLPTISAGQPATQNLTTLSDADISAYRWDAMAQYYLSERGTFAAAQNGMDLYHQSERNAAQGFAIQYGPPGR